MSLLIKHKIEPDEKYLEEYNLNMQLMHNTNKINKENNFPPLVEAKKPKKKIVKQRMIQRPLN